MGDHLGSTTYVVSGTVESGESRYLPWGQTRFTSGTTPTTYRYTGQREESSIGLYYYGARWYDPGLGRFIQPDTIVPNPRDAQAFDRYAYANNNPLKYIDPTGHIAVCFQGGPGSIGSIIGSDSGASSTDAQEPYTEVGMLGMCQNALNGAGYDPEKHGPIMLLNNNRFAISQAFWQVHAQKDQNPDEPVIIMGYSWGGASALMLADALTDETIRGVDGPVAVDLLLTVDAETDPVWVAGHTPTILDDDVKFAVNLYAGAALGSESSFQNGTNDIEGALNVELVNEDHLSAAWGAGEPTNYINPETQEFMRIAVDVTLQGLR